MNTIIYPAHTWTSVNSTRVFAITRLPSLLPPLHCLSLRNWCRHVTFPSLKKRFSVMTWFLSEYKKGDTVKFSTWPFLWAVYTAFGLSVDPLTRAFKCKHGWWMAMLIKWAELAVFIRFIKVFVLYKTFKRVWSVGGTAVLFRAGLIMLCLINASMLSGAEQSGLSKTPGKQGRMLI